MVDQQKKNIKKISVDTNWINLLRKTSAICFVRTDWFKKYFFYLFFFSSLFFYCDSKTMSSPSSNITHEEKSRSRSPSPHNATNGKKTVIETRRAEQNRAAQRAFRQRKELYVKELETKVNAMADWPARMEQLERENEQLKRKLKAIEEEEISRRKSIKLEYASSTSSNSYNQRQKYTSSSSQPQPHQETNKVVVDEKTKSLDNLVTILKTRNSSRPPIPTYLPN